MMVKTRIETVTTVHYDSRVYAGVTTTDPEMAKVIEWADSSESVWDIVRQTRSSPFGRNSSTYMGCARGDTPFQALGRAAVLKDECQKPGIWGFRARHTLTHYRGKGFKGGLFREWDGSYYRNCINLDFTTATLEEVLDQFHAWCGKTYDSKELRLDGKTLRVVHGPFTEKKS
jgi:hypothetical protein